MRCAMVVPILLAGVLAGCGKPQSTPPPEPKTSPPATTQPEESAKEPAVTPPSGMLEATVRVIDLDGAPLAHMAPIATREPNAFDTPVATGSATGPDGMGTIRFAGDQHLFLRAWDPGLTYFPNNFYEVLPGGNTIDSQLTVQMAPAASLEAQFVLPSGEPAANQPVGLMLMHPTRGPWFPAESQTDAGGNAEFTHLPAGSYVMRFKVESGPRLEYPETPLPPGNSVNLGVLALQ